jgi:hypothetical protein
MNPLLDVKNDPGFNSGILEYRLHRIRVVSLLPRTPLSLRCECWRPAAAKGQALWAKKPAPSGKQATAARRATGPSAATALTEKVVADLEIARTWQPGTPKDDGKRSGSEKGFRP